MGRRGSVGTSAFGQGSGEGTAGVGLLAGGGVLRPHIVKKRPEKSKIMTEEKLSLKEIRDRLYESRDFELAHLWQRSVFLTAFILTCFSGYGSIVEKIIDGNNLLLHQIACGISLAGVTFSIIWVKMAKGSKAWYETYVRKINDIEEELSIPGDYRMQSCRLWGKGSCDEKFFTTKPGLYSLSKLNIVIGIALLSVWLLIFTIHYSSAFCLTCKEEVCSVVNIIVLVVVPVALLAIWLTARFNRWAKSEDLKEQGNAEAAAP